MAPGAVPDVAPIEGLAPAEDGAELPSVKELADAGAGRFGRRKARGRARRCLRAILEVDPENPEAFLLAAFAHADTGDLDSAVLEANQALAIDPLIAAARYILGIIYLRMDDPMRATLRVQEDDLHRRGLRACASQPGEPVSSQGRDR